jgi:hypothetical protein
MNNQRKIKTEEFRFFETKIRSDQIRIMSYENMASICLSNL